MDKVKKRLNKTSQLLSEKVGGNKGTELEEEIQELWRRADVISTSIVKVIDKTKEYLRPNPSERRKYHLHASYHKAKGDAETHKYSQPEHRLAEVVKRFGTNLFSPEGVGGESMQLGSAYACSLVELGNALEEIADAKETLDASLRLIFLQPLHEMQENDVKEIHQQQKKMEGRRLDYDYKESKAEKFTSEELDEAESKYRESKQLYYERLAVFVDNEAEHIGPLNAFVQQLKEYHQRCTDIMGKVTDQLEKIMAQVPQHPGNHLNYQQRQQQHLEVPDAAGFKSSRSSLEISDDDGDDKPSVNPRHREGGSNASLTPSCRAVYDYDAETGEDLEFVEGDVITLLSKIDENWLYGSLNGKEGLFPTTYVEILVPL